MLQSSICILATCAAVLGSGPFEKRLVPTHVMRACIDDPRAVHWGGMFVRLSITIRAPWGEVRWGEERFVAHRMDLPLPSRLNASPPQLPLQLLPSLSSSDPFLPSWWPSSARRRAAPRRSWSSCPGCRISACWPSPRRGCSSPWPWLTPPNPCPGRARRP